MSDPLKPCPFCGGDPVALSVDGGDYTYNHDTVECTFCGAQITAYATPEAAESAWNHRPGEDAAVEAVAKYVEDDRGLKELASTIRERFGGKP